MELPLTVVICTHNRSALLRRALGALNQAKQVPGVRLLVIANACTDDTHALLDGFKHDPSQEHVPLEWIAEPTPGKSAALNRAIGALQTRWATIVDDDQRVDPNFFTAIATGIDQHPTASMFCGRLLPDWDGTEPDWVHEQGKYRIYPLPVPQFDLGDQDHRLREGDARPSGGNLVLQTRIFAEIGGYSLELGPRGHDLGGGEDSEFLARALHHGERLYYLAGMRQRHHVEHDRLKRSYLLKKSYHRSKASMRIHTQRRKIPLYVWRLLIAHLARALFTFNPHKRHFYAMRLAATLGECAGVVAARQDHNRSHRRRQFWPRPRRPAGLAASGALLYAIGWFTNQDANTLAPTLGPAAGLATLFTAALTVKSVLHFSQTGPQIREEILNHYRRYTVFAVARLAAWSWLLIAFLASIGAVSWWALVQVFPTAESLAWGPWLAPLAAIAGTCSWRFCSMLLHQPAALVASISYRWSRLYPLWKHLTPGRLSVFGSALVAGACAPMVLALADAAAAGNWPAMATLAGAMLVLAGGLDWLLPDTRGPRLGPRRGRAHKSPPNLLMLGSDTLRADRIGAQRNGASLTPRIDALIAGGIGFTNCYVPCARTAPSLLSLFTGTWPHHHGVRDNFVSDAEVQIKSADLATILRDAGYQTAVVSDWCGADFGKFSFGFEQLDLPDDQWNLKYLIRQGPRDLRLFLSLFSQGCAGRQLLPELHFLGGIPTTDLLGQRTRAALNALGKSNKPFFLNTFFSTTHPPFGARHPYYTRFTSPDYAGESRFAMARLTDPFDIIERQGEAREEFDLDQVLNLYDSCVAEFDDEVGKVLDDLSARGMADNTIVVIYSDHGMEFFEHDTWGQGNSARGDASPRVPLVIADPRRAGRGRVTDLVRSIDLMPTLLELLELPVPQSVDGASVLPWWNSHSFTEVRPAINETGIWLTDLPGTPPGHLRYPQLLDLLEVSDKETGTLSIKAEHQADIVRAKDRMLCRDGWKLVYQPLEAGPMYLLFDLRTDPGCKFDVLDQHPKVGAGLIAELEQWLAQDPVMTPAVSDAAKASQRTAASKAR